MGTPDPNAALAPLTDDAVLAANSVFYHALDTANLAQMELAWKHSDDSLCAHPGRAPLRGWRAIEASWRSIFASGGNPQVITTEVAVFRRGTVAWVTLSENLLSGANTGAASALNIFEHDGSRWRMVAHQAAPVLAQ